MSALGRSMEQDRLPALHNLIQTDAAINPGNSGGPLLDVTGRAIGINTAALSSAHGIGFPIAIDDAKAIVRALIARGRVERASLDICAVSVAAQVAWANELPMEQDVLVTHVREGGPGAAAGLAEGDVIVALSGRQVGRSLHVEFVGPAGGHHVFAVRDAIRAEFHRSGEHPYVVHFYAGRPVELRGVVRVTSDIRSRPPGECTGVTVEDTCLER